MRMASVYYQGMFDTKRFRLPDRVTYKKELSQKSQFWNKLKEFMNDGDAVCDEILVDGQKYQKGDLIVIQVLDGGDTLKVGVIKMILLRGDADVYFVNTQYLATKNELGFFQSSTVETEFMFTESRTLADSKPLILRGTLAKFVFILHHHVSFQYC